MNPIKVIIGIVAIIIGIATIITPFLPIENICDVFTSGEAIITVFVGVIICVSGLFNVFES